MNLSDFLRVTTPGGAKEQLEKMLDSGQISRDTLSGPATQAKQIAQMMGLK